MTNVSFLGSLFGWVTGVALLLVLSPPAALADYCFPPQRPFVPVESQDLREYEAFIRSDFEIYFKEIQDYFACLDSERSRAFEEARAVSQEYGLVLQRLND